MDTQPDSSFFDNVSIYFDQAASFTQYPKGLLDQIKVCNSVYSFGLISCSNHFTYAVFVKQKQIVERQCFVL